MVRYDAHSSCILMKCIEAVSLIYYSMSPRLDRRRVRSLVRHAFQRPSDLLRCRSLRPSYEFFTVFYIPIEKKIQQSSLS